MIQTLEYLPSKSNYQTAKLGEIFLHSRFDPLKEAIKLAEATNIPEKCRLVILLNPGAYHLNQILSLRYQVISCESYINPLKPPTRAWDPTNSENLDTFISSHCYGLELEDIVLFPYLPGMSADGEAALKMQKTIQKILIEESTFSSTTKYFRDIWIRNSIRNLLLTNFPSKTSIKAQSYIELCMSGPSLEKSIPELKIKKHLRVIASSALTFFKNHNLPFDTIIHGDGGFWGKTLFSHPITKLIASIRSALPNRILNSSDISFFCASPLESLLFQMIFEENPIMIEENVNIALLSINFLKSQEPVYLKIFGLDFAYYDGKSHASPHQHLLRFENNSIRTNPYFNSNYEQLFSNLPKKIETNWYSNFQLETFYNAFSKMNLKNISLMNNIFVKETTLPAMSPTNPIIKKLTNKINRKKSFNDLIKPFEKELKHSAEDLLMSEEEFLLSLKHYFNKFLYNQV